MHPDWDGYPPPGETWARGTPNMWKARMETPPVFMTDGVPVGPALSVAGPFVPAPRDPVQWPIRRTAPRPGHAGGASARR